jgi:16S rRNA (adenine1518-N6/adenine1519-N6)-dimethyltransferase
MNERQRNRLNAEASRPPARVDGHRPNKRFGQNFLHDPAVISRIVRVIQPKPDDRMVEIGPGLGALTAALLPSLQSLDVIELDHSLVPRLLEKLGHPPALRVHVDDALTVDFRALAGDGPPLRVVGNLPYNISTPLLFHLMAQADRVRDMHFMLQKEVVTRLTAAPGGRDYGRLTVTVGARARCDSLFDVGPGAFNPPPKVTSSVVRITPRPPPLPIRDLVAFDRVVTAAFSQRRKTLGNAMKSMTTAAVIESAGIDPKARAETLSLEDFIRLCDAVGHAAV